MYRIITALLTCLPVLGAAAQDYVLERLEQSPRHHEWIQVERDGRTVHCFVVYPEVPEKATAVLIIHENRGLTDWVRGVADQVAEAGYIAIAPDLLSGHGPDGGKTSDFPNEDAAREALYGLDDADVMAELNAAADYAVALPAANGKLAVAGFCWGGGQTLRFATYREAIDGAFVFYGSYGHTNEELARIQCPVYGFYGGNDARVNATIPGTSEAMGALGKKFEPVIYDGAGHGFMRSGEGPDASTANHEARAAAWERWKDLLSGL